MLTRRGERLHVSLWSLQRDGRGGYVLGLCQTEAEGTPKDGRLVASVVPFKSFAQVVDRDDVRRGAGSVTLRFQPGVVVVERDSFDCGRDGGDLAGDYRPSRAPAVTLAPHGPALAPPSASLMYRAIHGDAPFSAPPKL